MKSVCIATSMFDATVSVYYHCTMLDLSAILGTDGILHYDKDKVKLAGHWVEQRDIVRSRSRFVQKFLFETEADYLLSVDADNSFDVRLIPAMIAAGKDVVGCTYPRKQLNWEKVDEAVRQNKVEKASQWALDYVYRSRDGETVVDPETFTLPVESLGFGCILMSRRCLQSMWDRYHDELWYVDNHPSYGTRKCVALFQLMISEVQDNHPLGNRQLLGEDYSFCKRWQQMGGEVYMYVGPHCEVGHSGVIYLEGDRQGYLKRSAP